MRLVIASAIAFLPLFASAKDFGAFDRLQDLTFDDAFQAQVKIFFKDYRDDPRYFDLRGQYVADEILSDLMGPSQEFREIAHNIIFGAACMSHNCDSRAAFVLSCPATIQAIATLEGDARVVIYFREENTTQLGAAELEQWGRTNLVEMREGELKVHLQPSTGPLEVQYRTQSNKSLQAMWMFTR